MFELPDGSYSIRDIQDYFKYIIKNHEIFTIKPPIQIYVTVCRIELHLRINILINKHKSGYCLKIITSEAMKLLRNTKRRIRRNKNVENVLHLRILRWF